MTNTITTLARTLTLTLATLVAGTGLAHAAAPATPVALEDIDGDHDRFDAAVTVEGQVNINTATQAELELLPGIGPSIAGRIISYRKDHPFKQRNHIMRIKGIGAKTFDKIKDHLVVEGETTLKIVK